MEIMRYIAAVLILCSTLSASAADLTATDLPDILVADFEGTNYGEWKTTGEAFGPRPAHGTLAGQMTVDGFQGKGLVNSFYGGDKSTGTLTSPPFKVQRRFINFLIGGGRNYESTCMNLLVDGKSVRSATGPNDRPGGTERLDWKSWEVNEFIGTDAVLRIVDKATGGWGHINIDHIVQSNRRMDTLAKAARSFPISSPFLNLPVRNGGAKRRVAYLVDGKVVREFEIELADSEPDFWAFSDVGSFLGQLLIVRVDRLPEGSSALKNIAQGATIKGSENLYSEKLRPQFHFSSRRGWLNDPNGLVYYKGEYHLYYQHNPFGWDWGNMHWGHAVSRDLVHWEELPIAVYPNRFGDWAFSGSAVVDKNNTAGFKSGSEDALVAAYTSTARGECILFSNDRGRTWQEYEGNPVVKHQGRDPKLIWHKASRQWVMAVYNESAENGKQEQSIAFYTSPNLKDWAYQSKIAGFFECPDIFELAVDGKADQRKWVLLAANDEYILGTFDGKTFSKESGKHKGNYGNCFYASQSYSDAPDGRRIQIGWGQAKLPGMPFNHMMTFPCDLSLRSTPDGIRMYAQPVKELETLRGKEHAWTSLPLHEGEDPLAKIRAELLELQVELTPASAEEITLTFRGTPIRYNVSRQELACSGRTAPLDLRNGKIHLQILADRASLEIFGNDGLVYMPIYALDKDGNAPVSLSVKGSDAVADSLKVYELNSAWRQTVTASR
jgi:fructan beta-fructosidase